MSNSFDENDKILRDYLALDRTKLANQRTLLAMIRTGLYFSVGGLTILTLKSLHEIKYLAFILFGLSIVFFVLGLFGYRKMNKKMNEAYKNFKR